MKNIIISFVLGAFLATLGLSYNDTRLTLITGEKLIVSQIQRSDSGWIYRLRKTDHRRFNIVSDKPLGYSKSDTLSFFGRIPKCRETTRGLHRKNYKLQHASQ